MEKRSGAKRNSKRSRAADLLAAVILLCLLIAAFSAAAKYIRYLRLDFSEAATTTKTAALNADMLVIRNESIIVAPRAGAFEPAVAAGARVGVGALIGYMTGEQSGSAQPYREPVYTPVGGVVYFAIDGWEEKLSIAALEQTDWSQALAVWESDTVTAAADTEAELESRASGRPVAKVVDNLVDFYALFYTTAPPDDFIFDERVSFRYMDGETERTLRARVTDSGELTDGRSFLLASISSDEELLLETRALSGDLLGESYSGLLVAASSIVIDEQGQAGVYRVRGKALEYTEVEIIKTFDDTVLINGVQAGDRVVSNPERAQAGQRVY